MRRIVQSSGIRRGFLPQPFPTRQLFTEKPTNIKYPSASKLNLVLDLDGTLITHAKTKSKKTLSKFRSMPTYFFDIKINGKYYCIFHRPYLFDYLKKWNNMFNLYVYTHSAPLYCDSIVKNLHHRVPELKIVGVQSRKIIFKNIMVQSRKIIKPELQPKDLQNLELNPNSTIILDDTLSAWPNDHINVLSIKTCDDVDESLNWIHKLKCDNELKLVDRYLHGIHSKVNDINLCQDLASSQSSSCQSNHKLQLCDMIADCNTKYKNEPHNKPISAIQSYFHAKKLIEGYSKMFHKRNVQPYVHISGFNHIELFN
jgi:hypothetical protein